MNRDGHNNVSFFVGTEVETTPAQTKKTLFVVGFQDTNKIKEYAKQYMTPHIFLGANHSFDSNCITTNFQQTWNNQILDLLNSGFIVTLDYPVQQHENLLTGFSKDIWNSRNFIPLLSVRIPNVQTSNVNLTIKIDDIDFKATNPGVWCMHYTQATDSNRFTEWKDYSTDEVISLNETTEFESEKTKSVPNMANQDTFGLDHIQTTALKPEDSTPNNELGLEDITLEVAADLYTGEVSKNILTETILNKPVTNTENPVVQTPAKKGPFGRPLKQEDELPHVGLKSELKSKVPAKKKEKQSNDN